MKSVSEHIPTIEKLDAQLDAVLGADLDEFLTATEDRRNQVKGNLKFILTALVFLLAISVFLFITGMQLQDGWMYKGVLMLALLWTTVLFIFGRAWFFNTRLLARKINMALVAVFTQVFDRQFLYTNNSDSDETVTALLRESSLITSQNITVHTDDSYRAFEAGEREVSFHELSVMMREPKEIRSNGRIGSEVFRGLLMVATLPYEHKAETYISTEGDAHGFAHQEFWSGILGNSTIEETELEWGEFENALHVASTDSTVTRELLTPDIMQGVYDWWCEHKLNIRLAFKGNVVYVLLPEASIRISTSTTSASQAVIKRYAMTLARPIWRGLKLVERVSR